MDVIEDCSEHNMVGAFLQGEIESRRYKHHILNKLAADGTARAVVDSPDFTNRTDNEYRRQLLAYRGYLDGTYLFTGFAKDWHWRRTELHAADMEKVKYGKFAAWSEFSEGTRLVARGANNFALGRIADETLHDIFGTIRKMLDGIYVAPVILIGTALDDALVVFEGHVRMTTYVLTGRARVAAIVGTSASAPNWYAY